GKIGLKSFVPEFLLDGAPYHGTASVGVTLFGGKVLEHSEQPLKRAELAMFQAKAAGHNTLRFFDEEMQAEVSARAALEADLREALQKQQLVLHYQPQVVGAGRIVGVEALVRCQHPLRGMVSPAEFIPLAEDTGLIFPLGQWVLDTACAQLAAWAADPALAHLTMAVNVSARQFKQADFVLSVVASLARTGANPKLLKLELTESMLVDDVEAIIAKMGILKAHGVGFSLDDFGTGYSSLAYLKRLPLDQLKIDQGFVRNIVTDTNDAAIAKMVMALAESLGLSVIAEGVELQAQANLLAHLGCHAYQGYLFSRPLPLEALEAFLRQAQDPR
ncbi:MAG: putative bifunctional diguanylate cyclase/phosphodiesterase, partial [Rhodoferax sp.]